MIDALPDVEDVRKGNAEKVKAQLDAIDDAKAELSDEEIDELDLSVTWKLLPHWNSCCME